MHKTLNTLIRLIGYTATNELLAAWGGTRLYVPARIEEHHPIALRIGPYNAEKLSAKFGRDWVEVPQWTTAIRRRRNEEIRSRYRGGEGTRALAIKFGLGERYIRKLVRYEQRESAR